MEMRNEAREVGEKGSLLGDFKVFPTPAGNGGFG
jgi:hypothetical protein